MLKYIWGLVFSALLLGCSTSFNTVNQVDSSAFIQFEGNFIGTVLFIDENSPINLVEEDIKTFNLDGRKVARFPIPTGRHLVKITRAGNLIVNRTIFVSNSNTFEVVVP